MLGLNPSKSDFWFNKGLTLVELGKYQEALDAYNKALEIDPSNPIKWGKRGELLYELGRYQEALDDFNKVLEIDPSDAIAKHNINVARTE